MTGHAALHAGEAMGLQDTRGRVDLAKLVWALSAALLVYLIVAPFGYMASESLTDTRGRATLANIPKDFGMPFVLEATTNTFLLSGAVTVLSVLLGVPLAFGVSRTDMWGKGLARSTVLISIITPISPRHRLRHPGWPQRRLPEPAAAVRSGPERGCWPAGYLQRVGVRCAHHSERCGL